MPRFTNSTKGQNTTVNYEGEKAYKLSNEMELYALVCTCSLQNKFYETSKEQLSRLRDLIRKVSPVFVAKLAIYAREKMNLRTIPVVLAVELAKVHKGDDTISRMVKRIIQRADEITEILGYYAISNNRTGAKKLGKVSNQLKKGIKEVFESGQFNEYHFSKYNRKTDVRFRDALFLTHPKPQSEEQKILFDKIAEDNLNTAYTWETQMSEAGKADSPVTTKKAVWEEMIDSNKMGYMALLRNLRNFIKEEVSQEHISKVCDILNDPERVAKSKQLPFRFLSAYRMLVGIENDLGFHGADIPDTSNLNQVYVNQVVEALEKAMVASAQNLPDFGDAVFATDVSGSMMKPVSDKSIVQLFDVGTVLCMMAYLRSNHSVTGMFGDIWKPVNFPKENILRNADEIRKREGETGYSTNGYKVLEWANRQKMSFDNFYIFTDCQLWDSDRRRLFPHLRNNTSSMQSEWKKYRERNPNAKLYLFDMAGHGNTPLDIRDNGVFLIAGWSNEVFTVLDRLQKGGVALDEIKDIEF